MEGSGGTWSGRGSGGGGGSQRLQILSRMAEGRPRGRPPAHIWRRSTPSMQITIFVAIAVRRQKDAKKMLKGPKNEFRFADKRTLKGSQKEFRSADNSKKDPKRTLNEIQSADKMVGCVWRTSKLLKN